MPGGRGSAAVQKPPPPVKQNVSLANGAATCPLMAKGDCTVHSLTVIATIIGRAAPGSPTNAKKPGSPAMATPVPRALQARKVLRDSKPSFHDDWEAIGLLRRYDLLLDVVTQGPTRDEPAPLGKIALLNGPLWRGRVDLQDSRPSFERMRRYLR